MEAKSPDTIRRSAGTMTPSLILTMSPGTKLAASTVAHLPSRSAVASGASPFFNAASAFDAFMSCHRSRAALNTSRAVMMTTSCQCPRMAETMAAASIM